MADTPDVLIEIAARHQSHYERLKASEVKKFDVFLVKMARDLRRTLTETDMTDFSRTRMERQLKAIGKMLTGTYAEYEKVWAAGIADASIYEAEFEGKTLDKVVFKYEFTLPSDAQVVAAVFSTPLGDIGGANSGSLLATFFKNESERNVKHIQGVIRAGYAEGKTTESIIREIRGTKASGFKDGTLYQDKISMSKVVRTSLQHASSQARNDVWKRNKDVIKGVRIVVTMDESTSATCRPLDGLTFKTGVGPRPPFHILCRTTTVAELDERYDFLSKGRTRSARDFETGDVVKISAKQTYYDRLKKMPASTQDSIIGQTRGKLFRNGGISTKRFAELEMGKNFPPATLDEMRKIAPEAFKKAGI